MSGTLHYRLVLRDPDDTIDEVTLSSLPADANPFLTAPPSGDGESLDPLTGAVGFAEYVFKVADLVGTLNTANVVMDEQWEYADSTARDAVWPVTQDNATSYTFTFPAHAADPERTVPPSLGTGGVALGIGVTYGGGIGGGAGFVKFTRTVTGLTPGAAYTVICDRLRLSRPATAFNDNCGISINGGLGQFNGQDGKVIVPTTADGSGNLTITLGHFDLEFGMTGMAMIVGRIRVFGPPGILSARVVTGLLADSEGRWTGVNRKASWYESTNSGATWTLIFAGWLTQVTLTGGIDWALHLGDSDRRERTAVALSSLPTGAGWTAMPLIGNLFGTTWRYHVFHTSSTNGDLPAQTVALRRDSPDLSADEATVLTQKARPFASGVSPNITFPALQATLKTTGGATIGVFTPWGQNPSNFFAPMQGVGTVDALLDLEGQYLMLQWPGTLPADGTIYDVQVGAAGSAQGGPTRDLPYVFIGHPVDFATSLLAEAGSVFDAASAMTVRAALGAGLQVTYAFTATAALMDLLQRCAFGPFGFAIRKTLANEWECFLTRRLPDAVPAETIGDNDIHTPEQETYDGDLSTQVTKVSWAMRRFTDGYGDDGQAITESYISTDAPIADYGVHEQRYELPGFQVAFGEDFADIETPLPPGAPANLDPFRQPESVAILARWGRGAPETDVSVLRSSGLAARLGDFVVLDLAHKPTIDLTATPTGVRGGARIMQILHRTLKPEGWQLRLSDAGITGDLGAPALTVPAFTLAQGTDTRHVATATLTNDGALTGLTVEYQVGTGATEPTGGTLLTPITPDASAHDLPAVPAGSTVWARARARDGAHLPSAWSAWASVALDAVPPVTSLATSAGANDTERVLTWTVGDATLPVRVRWKATADASYLHSVTLPAGSNTYTITGVVPGTAMTAAVDHLELSPFTGDSADATTTWTAGSTTPTLTAPSNPQGFTDGAGTFGLRVTASVLPSRTVFMMALETGVGTGLYGTPVEVGNIASVAGASACVVTLTRANDGLRVQLTAHHAKTGYSDSSDTAPVTLNPWETTATPPGETSDAAYALVGAVPAGLPNARQLEGESGVVSVTDGGAGAAVTVGLEDGGVPLAKLMTTGTADDTTFLRGDGVWTIVTAGGSGTIIRRSTFTFRLPHAEAGTWDRLPIPFATAIVSAEVQDEDGRAVTATVELEAATDAGFPTFTDLTGGHDVVLTADDRVIVDATDLDFTDWSPDLTAGTTLRARILSTDQTTEDLLVVVTTEDELTAQIAIPRLIVVPTTLRVVGESHRQVMASDATVVMNELQGRTSGMTATVEIWRAPAVAETSPLDFGVAPIGTLTLDGSEADARGVDATASGFTSVAIVEGDTLEFRLTALSVAGDLDAWLTLRVGDASGVGGFGGTVAVGKIPKVTGAQTMSASALSDDGTNVTSSEPLILQGGLVRPVRTVSGSTTLDASDYLLIVTASATVNLPAAASHAGRAYEIVPTSGATATVDPSGSELIDGAATLALTAGALIASDGTGWHSVSRSVDLTGASDGDVATYDATAKQYLPAAPSGGGSAPQWATDDARTPLASPHTKSDAFPGTSLAAKWTQVNMTGATLSVARSRLIIATPSAGGVNFNSRLVTQPVETTPWSISARLILSGSDDFHSGGLFVRDGTGAHVTAFLRVSTGDAKVPATMAVGVDYMTSLTVRSSFPASEASALLPGAIWLRLRDDGTNLYADWSWTGDADEWMNYWSAGRAAFISATQSTFGIYADNLSTMAATAAFQSFTVANSA